MELNKAFQFLTYFVGLLLMVCGFYWFFSIGIKSSHALGFVMPLYVVFFGLLLILNEQQIPLIVENFGFLSHYLGRAFYLLYVSLFVFVTQVKTTLDLFQMIGFVCCIIMSVFYTVMHFKQGGGKISSEKPLI